MIYLKNVHKKCLYIYQNLYFFYTKQNISYLQINKHGVLHRIFNYEPYYLYTKSVVLNLHHYITMKVTILLISAIWRTVSPDVQVSSRDVCAPGTLSDVTVYFEVAIQQLTLVVIT